MMKAIGLMSGTSADGIDAALIGIKGKGPGCKVNLLSFKKFPFPEGLQKLIHKASTPEYGRVDLICHLNFLMGELFAEAAIGVVKKTGYKMEDIDVIGSHGQTIYHIPTGVKSSEFGVWSSELNRKSQIASTLQIGEPSIIAERTGVTTIADFRTRDMAAGGLGAPLTPFAHYMLFKDGDIGKAVNNIGGISNLTFIPAGGGLDDLVAFDTGPGNMLIDSIVNIITKGEMSYDNNGKIALKGKICEKLLEKLMAHPFIKKKPPKSTGREEFGYNEALKIFRTAKRHRLSDEDIVATVTGFTAKSIAESYHRFILNKHHLSEIILCGGGAKNPAIIKMIKNYMKPIKVNTSDRYGFPPEAIEAIAFAILGYAAVIGIPSNLPQVTGAGKKVVMGKIIKGKNQ